MDAELIARSQHLYQPIVHLESGKTVGFEALVRGPAEWGLESPLRLFEWAEARGWAEELDIELFSRAIDGAPLHGDLFINVRGTTVVKHWETIVRNISQFTKGRITVEVTEQVDVRDLPMLVEAARRIHEAGARVALDDVGSGYASLEWLMRMEPDVLKVDLVFSQAVVDSPWAREIVRSLTQLSKSVGSALVAEGIETEAMREALQQLGVRWGQGYLFSRPAPAEAFAP
ncbi:MAG: EAL domain-containing protein [Alicyclobacillaceae bacterium]|nr:EAL domain-containing protein [Alicyclobacillaceae bacterium]